MEEQKDEHLIQLLRSHTEYVEWEKVVRSKSQHLNWMRALNPEGTGAPSKSDIEAFEAVVTSDTNHLALLVRRIVHLGKDHQAQTCSALSNVALILDHRKANKGTVEGREQCEMYHNQDSFLSHIAKDALTDSVGMLALGASVMVAFRKGAREPEVLTNCEITVPKAENIGQEEVDGARHGKNTTKEEEQDVKDPEEGQIMQKEEMAKEAEKEIKTETQV